MFLLCWFKGTKKEDMNQKKMHKFNFFVHLFLQSPFSMARNGVIRFRNAEMDLLLVPVGCSRRFGSSCRQPPQQKRTINWAVKILRNMLNG